MKSTILFSWFFLFFLKESNCQTNIKDSANSFDFSEITFHSTACNGTCPDLSINIYKSRQIEVSREIYKAKGEIDTTRSGNFKGFLSEVDYQKLIALLKKINWDTISFPKVTCCDGAIVSIILSYNGKYMPFKSMTPPASTIDLIDFLKKIATSKSLAQFGGAIDFEEVN
jgi:Domain of unknown function (DUF6438)